MMCVASGDYSGNDRSDNHAINNSKTNNGACTYYAVVYNCSGNYSCTNVSNYSLLHGQFLHQRKQ
jgi:hypothetical protein